MGAAPIFSIKWALKSPGLFGVLGRVKISEPLKGSHGAALAVDLYAVRLRFLGTRSVGPCHHA